MIQTVQALTRPLARRLSAALVLALLANSGSASASLRHRHDRHHRSIIRPQTFGVDDAYAARRTAKPDCRYPDGTPFDPDIIGGANHVGDGGPAVNWGGFPPCGY